ncbi:TRAP transporter fused permease subunit [Haloferax sp. MBLA0076]|uniref:TRAP transporter fused permease subunit n=1 Tax=Haloferax litoreum TaxID=2666140 RepID=A0A6A8GEY7_9EURY|nr:MULTISPECIES: TRAP transporter fused permease subunit [Haloferax]KAB1192924.1 TRAP transporter permease [Haloferax sp. CBA1148]MRX21411.1 TRAP transporter fused permease subunit [Haloferax litoreum]
MTNRTHDEGRTDDPNDSNDAPRSDRTGGHDGDVPPVRTDGGEAPNDSEGTETDEEISEEEAQEMLEGIDRKRTITGWAAIVTSFIAITFSVFQVWLAARGFDFSATLPLVGEVSLGSLQLLQVNSIHVAFALILAFILFPPTTGHGAVATRLGRVVPSLASSLGEDSPVTRAAAGVRRFVRWLAVDPDRERVTPVDLLFIVLAAATAIYMVMEWSEIQQLRIFGLNAGRTVAEYLGPLGFVAEIISAVGIPLAGVSYPFFLGVVGVLLVLEATRRSLGFYLTLIVASFIVYAKYGFLISPTTPLIGVLSIPEGTWANIIQNLWYNTENGVFGIPVTVSVQFIYIFILFGAFLEMSGAGQWFIDLAYAATGTRKGGPAKASILASGFMGTISGSSIANTVTTGAFTIPLMKRSGYRSEFAGAVEASASSGGQILPPVMGAAAFLMIEFIGVPFSDIIIAAAIPAVVFFFGVWVMVHLEATRANIGGLDRSEVVDLRFHLARGWFYLIPILLLLYYLLVERLTVARSAWFTLIAIMALLSVVAAYNERTRIPLIGGIVTLFVAQIAAYATAGVGIIDALTGGSGEALGIVDAVLAAAGELGILAIFVSLVVMLARPALDSPLLEFDDAVDEASDRIANAVSRPSLSDVNAFRYVTFIGKSMDSGARTSTEVVVAVAAAGIIPGVVSATGLGPNLTALIKAVAGGSIVLLLLFTAIASIILGMGMPTTVTYIILVSLLGPAIAQSSDIPLLAAHLFILYFGVIADITPPVAVAAYAASGIARSDPFQTGVKAFSLSLNKAVVPFAFALTPGILLLRGRGEQAAVITGADIADLGFFIPEVVIPVLGVFIGVIALGATVIGYFYSRVTRVERGLFAVAAFLLMAPMLLLNAVFDLGGALGLVGTVPTTVTVDLAMRGVGGIIFGALALKNRREAEQGKREAPAGSPEPTD